MPDGAAAAVSVDRPETVLYPEPREPMDSPGLAPPPFLRMGFPMTSQSQPTPLPARKAGPFEFLAQVREEGSKVTWPTRREVAVTTGMVFAFVLAATLFIAGLDAGFRFVAAGLVGA